MPLKHTLALLAGASSLASTYATQFDFSNKVEIETCAIDEIYQAVLKEGGNAIL